MMFVSLLGFALLAVAVNAQDPISLGPLMTRAHTVAGEVFVISETVLEVKGFVYDGDGPAAYFWADESQAPSDMGLRLYDSEPVGACGKAPLSAADGTATYRFEFPIGSTINDFLGGSISIWCEVAAVNFGEVIIPASFEGTGLLAAADGPALECSTTEITLGELNGRNHNVAGEVVILSERVLEVRGFTYDGAAPAVFFWADTNAKPSNGGFELSDGSPTNGCGLRAIADSADGTQTYRVEFPEGTSVLDILGGSISVWCEEFSANFGEVIIPDTLEGVAATEDGPLLECSANPVITPVAQTPSGFNCEELNDEFQVRWAVDGDNIAVELVGVISETEYMGFGLSGSATSTFMVGADPVIVDTFGGDYRARDFYMNDRSQCSGGNGVCPDTETDGAVDDVSAVSGDRESGVTLVRYKKALVPSDTASELDQTINVTPGVSSFIIWAIGPVSPDTGLPQFHSAFPRSNFEIEFGRDVADNCTPLLEVVGTPEPPKPFQIPILKDTTEIVAQIGPSGFARGYAAITNMTSWGIAWYMNDLLIPVIELRRGTTYTFRVSGGNNPESNAEFHPFYLTSSPLGGYFQRTPEERAQETIYAGIDVTETDSDGGVLAFESTIQAPLCIYKVTDTSQDAASEDSSYQDFFDTLDTSCQQNTEIIDAAAVLEFTPDDDTPDLIYYHCVTHRNLGWKIMVIDGDEPSSPAPATSTNAPVTTSPTQSPMNSLAAAPVTLAPSTPLNSTTAPAVGDPTSSAMATGFGASIAGAWVLLVLSFVF